MVPDDIYAALSTIAAVDGIYDTKLPDGYVVTGAVLVFSSISDVADTEIRGDIVRREQRWQISIRVADTHAGGLTRARGLKAAVIAALHGYSGPTIARCDFESAPGEIFESDILPFQFHIPVDFMLQI